MPDGNPSFCICVPARNEAEALPLLLDALAEQDWPGVIPISIAINNTSDDSVTILDAAADRYAGRLVLHVQSVTFAPQDAHAGSARKMAMDHGLSCLSDVANGLLISTDADTRPPRQWLTAIAAAFGRGADLVGGRIDIDGEAELPMPVRRRRAAWDSYWATVRAIEDAVDPVAWDPAPRHGDHTGASLAIRASVYQACGGVPLLACGEDRALVLAALAIGARLVHPADVHVRVSPRTSGRAQGGMAEAMHALFAEAETGASIMAPDFSHWRERALWRQSLRIQPHGQRIIAQREPLLPPMPHDMALKVMP